MMAIRTSAAPPAITKRRRLSEPEPPPRLPTEGTFTFDFFCGPFFFGPCGRGPVDIGVDGSRSVGRRRGGGHRLRPTAVLRFVALMTIVALLIGLVVGAAGARLFPDLVVAALGDASFTVRNQGIVAARAFSVSLSGASGPQTFRFASGLAAGASATTTFACEAGARTAIADSGGEVVESDEANNSRSAATSCSPDLVISELTRTSFTVSNQGTAPAGAFYVRVSDSDPADDVIFQFSGLAAGASAGPQAFNCRDLPRTATADGGQDIPESNEANNTRTIAASGCG